MPAPLSTIQLYLAELGKVTYYLQASDFLQDQASNGQTTDTWQLFARVLTLPLLMFIIPSSPFKIHCLKLGNETHDIWKKVHSSIVQKDLNKYNF